MNSVDTFKYKRILVTGGAGFVGSHIIDLLIKEKGADSFDQIIALDNFARGRRENLSWAESNGPVTVVEGDIRDRKLLEELARGSDLIFHMAALRITQCAAEPRLALETMVDSVFNLLEAAVKHGVKKIVSASSASVYGMAEEFPTTENQHPYDNRTFYGAAKLFNEGLLRSFHDLYGLNYVAMRYFNVYGPRMDRHGVYTEVMIRWMERIVAGESPVIFGDGEQTMDFVYVEDVARANILAAGANTNDEVFNVASGEETSLNELARLLLKIMGAESLEIEYATERKVNPVQRRLADTSKARRLLGFKAKTSLEEGLKRFTNWWEEEKNKESVANGR